MVGPPIDAEPRVKAFLRPCSGYGGTLTRWGRGHRQAVFLQPLTMMATAAAQYFYCGLTR